MKPLVKLILLFLSLFLCGGDAEDISEPGTYENPVIDSAMSCEQALEEFSANCPLNIKDRQRLINVKYYSFDDKIHQGQLVVDMDLADDIEFAFGEALKEKFQVFSVIPMSDVSFRKNGLWDDNLSMEANNTSCFNYRTITGSNIIVRTLLSRGWEWGGNWTDLKDYQHLEKK